MHAGDLPFGQSETAKLDGKVWLNPRHGHGASVGRFIRWHTIKDQPSSVVGDVGEHPLVAEEIPIYGYLYDVYFGNLVEGPEASKAGVDLSTGYSEADGLSIGGAFTVGILKRLIGCFEDLIARFRPTLDHGKARRRSKLEPHPRWDGEIVLELKRRSLDR